MALILVAAALVTAGVVIILMAVSLLRPPRMSDGKAVWILRRLSPGDLGLHFEPVSYSVRDERSGDKLRLAGWWIPHPGTQSRCVVLLHGYGDAKVGAIAWAPLWNELGFNILAIDLRAHGESEGSFSTGGFWERHDLSQVLDELRASRPDQTNHLMLFGASLGATVAPAIAAIRDDLAGIVLDSPYDDFCDAARIQMNGLGAPGRTFQVSALRLAEKLSAARFDDIRLANLLPSVRCPIFLIAPEADPLLPAGARQALLDGSEARGAAKALDKFWSVPDCGHLLALACHRDEYAQRLAMFTQEAIEARRPAPALQAIAPA